MNRTVLSDKVFMWVSKLPHARFFQNKFRNKAIAMASGRDKDLSIIAANCIGGEIYHILGWQFCSPFINNSMGRHSFITMACHFKEYMQAPYRLERAAMGNGLCLILEPKELPEVPIRFPHDVNADVVKSNWERRVKRINYEKLVFICDDRGLDLSDFEAYDRVKAYKKVMLTSKEIGYAWATVLPSRGGKSGASDYNYKDYLLGIWRFEKEWNYYDFLFE